MLGFTAIQISPITKQANDYLGYSTIDWTQLNEHFGTEDDLKGLVSAAHDLDMLVMVDMVPNHMADGSLVDLVPFNDASYYHDSCEIYDWMNQDQVEICRVEGHPDLD
mmetsp:Transcript_29306/g.44146  ORF Transcript_29306/g.44146 Transcript_29306/m.44146 type:complete len:108 (+) Transcript_29306:196-519(+)